MAQLHSSPRVPRGIKKKDSIHQYCPRGLLAKILRFRLNVRYDIIRWGSSWDNLDDTIEALVGSSMPVEFDPYLRRVQHLIPTRDIIWYPGVVTARKLRKFVDGCIQRILIPSSRRSCPDTKLNALKTLAKFGLIILESLSSQLPPWIDDWTAFIDHLSEDAITGAMMAICHSLAKMDGVKSLSDQQLLDYLEE